MVKRKCIPHKFRSEERREFYIMLEEIKDVCNKYRGNDTDIDTPFKYTKNYLAYSIKQYAENYIDYLEDVHFEGNTFMCYPRDLRARQARLIDWTIEPIKTIRDSESDLFRIMLKESKKGD